MLLEKRILPGKRMSLLDTFRGHQNERDDTNISHLFNVKSLTINSPRVPSDIIIIRAGMSGKSSIKT